MMGAHLGYYTVGTEVFHSKTAALVEATRTNIHPQWHFSDHVFSRMDWESPPVDDITEMYKRRAKQLREKYDYLILMFSGGSDSTTIIRSFIQAGVHLDEILVKWSLKASEKVYTPNTTDHGTHNIFSEWDYAIKPTLDYIATHHPKIKITIYDFSDQFDGEISEQDWFSVNDHLNPGVFRRYGLALTESQEKMQEAGKSVATIWGIDKPQLAYKDGNIYAYFLDKLANTRSVEGSANRTNELFYWTPDVPEVAVNQAKKVYNYISKRPDLLPLIDWVDPRGKNKTLYDNIARGIIHPEWDTTIFQVTKPSNMVFNEYDTWMFKSLQPYRYYQSWENGLTSIKAVVDPKYFQPNKTGRFEGWIGFISPFYKLGPAKTINLLDT